MADYIAVPARVLYRIPDEITFEQAVMVEPVAIASHAIFRSPARHINDTVMVFDVGTIGLFILQILSFRGISELIAVDIDDIKLRYALKNGATHIINSKFIDPVDVIADLDKEQRCGYCF